MTKLFKEEINKLDKLLTKRNISHEKTMFTAGADIWIPKFGDYEFRIYCTEQSRGYSQGLLEVNGAGRGVLLEPTGYLHAEEAMELMEVIVA